MENLPVVDILKVGLSGLVFLFTFLAYRLLQQEQQRGEPRDKILQSIYRFMWMSVLLAFLVGGFDLLKWLTSDNGNEEQLAGLKQQFQQQLMLKNQEIDSLKQIIETLNENQLSLQQQIDLGLYYAQAVGWGKAERRDSERARKYLFDALRNHAEALSERRKAEIVSGLVNIREKITDEEDFAFLIRSIEQYKYGIERELDLAKVYWAATYTNRDILRKRRLALVHFLKAAAGDFPRSISREDIADIGTIIKQLQRVDNYLRQKGNDILKSVRKQDKEKIRRYLEEWQRHWSV
ncbi:MAG: hypothetical protein D6681_11160 [Calditrichaeota bacterium]|nr:MAG: hypothetical protein D6681_11160 [Calditrichota bacterium]